MRTYGRTTDEFGNKTWQVVTTDPATGLDDLVWVTTLIQCLKLAPGESPFYGNYGVPAQTSVITQILPDYYVALTQRQFASRFASLIVSRVNGAPEPTYTVNVITHVGTPFQIEGIAV